MILKKPNSGADDGAPPLKLLGFGACALRPDSNRIKFSFLNYR